MMKLVNISLYFWHGFKGHDRKGSKGSRKNVIEAPRQSDKCVDAYIVVPREWKERWKAYAI